MSSLADIRNEYKKATLDITDIDKNPVKQFEVWFSEVMKAGATEPTAMTLSTVTADGRPSGRIVLLKGVEHGKFVFYTNYQSQKGIELEKNPYCALTFFWPELERQVRIEGMASRLSEGESEKYFHSRPRGSQIGAWASPQSSPIANRKLLEDRVKDIEAKFKGIETLPKPKQWGGYGVEPLEIEFWQGRESRLHDRIVYTLADGEWKIMRLAP